MTSNDSRDQTLSPNSFPTTHHVKRQSSALHGASHAFYSAPPALKPLPKTYSGTNGALAAAASAAGRRRREDASDNVAFSQRPNDATVRSKSLRPSGPSNNRGSPRQSPQSREQSPSYTAALLATSRSGTPKSTPPREPTSSSRPVAGRPSPSNGMNRDTGAYGSTPAIDDTPSKATTSLVQLFESKQNNQSSAPLTQSVRYYTRHTPAIASPTPVRPLKPFSSSAMVPLSTFPATSTTNRLAVAADGPKPSHAGALAAAAKLAHPTRAGTISSSQRTDTVRRVPELPRSRRSSRQHSLDGSVSGVGAGSNTSPESHPSVSLYRTAKRPAMPRSQTSDGGLPKRTETRSTSTANLQSTHGDEIEAFLNDATQILQDSPPLSAAAPPIPTKQIYPTTSSLRPSNLPSRPPLQPSATSDPVRRTRKTTRSLDSYVPQLSVDSLANAMVASSLASSRVPSPTKPPPLPPPRRLGKSYSLFHHHHSQEQISRTPSPAKTMRHTMREPIKSDDEGGYKKRRGHIVRKHHNKHHEGDRKRYRNQVTERERKRYEGVWAANKGLLMDAESSQAVINIVVRDIWRRSHLPDDVLEEVWDLVDTQGVGKLEREEFVVGMFLIDSRLKGNKLPFKISDSLWSSVRRLTGIKVPQNRR